MDNGDNDGFADPNETVQVYVTLRNNSGSDQNEIVVRMGSTDPTVACIPTPVVSFGSLLAGEVREAALPLVFQMANAARVDVSQDLLVTLDFAISGEDFGTTTKPQSVTLEADLNVSGGLLPTTYTEGFENAGFGSFTTQSLDLGRESLLGSDGHRCQYNDPDFVNSNSYGYTDCFLGAATTVQNAYDWHVHGLTSPDGGRAYLGNNSLHWGVHGGAASQDTSRLRQLDAIRTFLPVNLGWNGVTSDLTFKHQVALVDGGYLTGPDYGETVDRGIVQVQLATSAGQATGSWRKISPYENVYNAETYDRYANCLFDPTDDGSDEDDYFDPADPARRLGPSSTCRPEFAFSNLGRTFFSAPFSPTDVGDASDGPGLQGSRGPGTWVESKFSLARWRGRRVRFRFLATSIEIVDAPTWQVAQGWNPIQGDDGWYIDDVRVTNTLTSAAMVSIDTADRSGLPACGPVCASVTPSLVVFPAIARCGDTFTLDASGSTVDQCHGGALQYRFWWIWRALPPGGTLNAFYAALLQDWSENAILSYPAQTFEENIYRVDVRCSALPACGGSTTSEVTVEASCPVLLYFPRPILFESKSVLSWGTPGRISAVRGDLGDLRASGGYFSPSTYWNFKVSNRSSLEDVSIPAPGEGRYYLLRGSRYPAPGSCAGYSFSTGSPAEVPGAGGNRDEDIGG
ncbi:MAG TPA: hypothetical protein VFV75_13120, partial [Candidatus Polarisedimenticolaceae bacterium]|nr:hypothetical protein [Candidatus Polarisedimenticolaceae bacterium]